MYYENAVLVPISALKDDSYVYYPPMKKWVDICYIIGEYAIIQEHDTGDRVVYKVSIDQNVYTHHYDGDPALIINAE